LIALNEVWPENGVAAQDWAVTSWTLGREAGGWERLPVALKSQPVDVETPHTCIKLTFGTNRGDLHGGKNATIQTKLLTTVSVGKRKGERKPTEDETVGHGKCS